MKVIAQKLEVLEWPLKKVGDEKFFGYVVAMGVYPRDWGNEDGMVPYVDFSYNDSYERYSLPCDEGLRRQLNDILMHNITGCAYPGDIYGKVWIKLQEHGYSVDLP